MYQHPVSSFQDKFRKDFSQYVHMLLGIAGLLCLSDLIGL